MTANEIPVRPDPDADRTGDVMDDRTREETDLRLQALQRLKKKADFRVHLLIYCLVNGMIVVIWAMTTSGFFWPIFPLLGWGVGLVANFYEAYVREEPTEDQVAAEVERLRRR